MLPELLAAVMIGFMLGIVSGLTPGLHINLMAAILLGLVPFVSRFAHPYYVAVAIISLSITHTFVNFIPVIFLGAASEETALATQAGNRLLLSGLGADAVRLAVSGCLLGLLAAVLASPALLFLVPIVFSFASPFIGAVLVAFSFAMVIWSKPRVLYTSIFLVSGLLGLVSFSIDSLSEPLLPMLSGLFGASLLIHNLRMQISVPRQFSVQVVVLKRFELVKSSLLGLLSGSIVNIFPALGPAQSATLATRLFGGKENSSYISLIGSVDSVSIVMALITAFSISKARNGAVAIVDGIISGIGLEDFFLFLAIILLASGLAAILTLYFARKVSSRIERINYPLACLLVLCLISALVFVFSGWIGLMVLATATSIGLLSIEKEISRTSLMGCLIIPVIFYYI